MPVRDTSRLSFEEKRKNLGPDQDAVFSIIEEIGPADDKRIRGSLNQKERNDKPKRLRRRWGINEVSPRRGELVDMRMIEDMGAFKHPERKREVHLWRVSGDKRVPVASWVKKEDNREPVKLPTKNNFEEFCRNLVKKAARKSGISLSGLELENIKFKKANHSYESLDPLKITNNSDVPAALSQAGRLLRQRRKIKENLRKTRPKQLVMF